MRLKVRFSLRMLLLLVAVVAAAVFIWLNAGLWHKDYLDWRSNRAIRARAEKVFRAETGAQAPSELIHILGSGHLAHWARVYDIGLTPDQIISCGFDKTVRCWSAETGEPLQVISNVQGHLADQSSMLVTIDHEQRVRVYDTGFSPLKLQREFSITPRSKIRNVLTSQRAGFMAVIYGEQPDEIKLLDLGAGKSTSTLQLAREARPRRVRLGFREDGRLLVALKDRFLLINSQNGEVINEWKQDPWPFVGQAIRHVVRLQDPWWLVIGASTDVVWNDSTHEWKEVEANFGGTPDLAVPGSSDTAWIADSGLMWRFSLLYDKPFRRPVRTTPIMSVRCMALRRYSGGGQVFTLRAVGYGRQVGLLDEYGRVRLPIHVADHVTTVAWNNGGNLLAAGTSAGEIVVLQTGSWIELQRFRPHGGEVKHLEFSPDSRALLSEAPHEIAVFDWRSAQPLVRKSRQASTSRDATLSCGGQQLLAWVLNEGWTLTDYSTNTLIARSERDATRPQSFSRQGPSWSESEQCFVFVSNESLCRLRIVGRGSCAGASLEIKEAPTSELGYLQHISTRDASVLFEDHDHSCLRIWNWRKAEEKRIELDTLDGGSTASFATTGRHVAVVVDSNLVLFTDLGEEMYRHRIGPARMSVLGIEFSPDGRYLATVNGNGTCYVFQNPCR